MFSWYQFNANSWCQIDVDIWCNKNFILDTYGWWSVDINCWHHFDVKSTFLPTGSAVTLRVQRKSDGSPLNTFNTISSDRNWYIHMLSWKENSFVDTPINLWLFEAASEHDNFYIGPLWEVTRWSNRTGILITILVNMYVLIWANLSTYIYNYTWVCTSFHQLVSVVL